MQIKKKEKKKHHTECMFRGTRLTEILSHLKWITDMFSVALIFIDQWLKSHPNLKAQCPYEISFVQFD